MRLAYLNSGEETLRPPDLIKKNRKRFSLSTKGMTNAIFVATMMLLSG